MEIPFLIDYRLNACIYFPEKTNVCVSDQIDNPTEGVSSSPFKMEDYD